MNKAKVAEEKKPTGGRVNEAGGSAGGVREEPNWWCQLKSSSRRKWSRSNCSLGTNTQVDISVKRMPQKNKKRRSDVE